MVQVKDSNNNFLVITAASLVLPGGSTLTMTSAGVGTGTFTYSGGSWYQPGQSYTMYVTIGSTTYSGSVTAAGGIQVPTFSNPGPITWTYPGNEEVIKIQQLFGAENTTTLGSPVTSGSVSTGSATYFSSAGMYAVTVMIAQTNVFAWTPSVSMGILEAEQSLYYADTNP
jgi:hypothetical protein